MATTNPTTDTSFGTATTNVSKSSQATLVSIGATNINIATRYLQLFNRSTALAGGEAPLLSFPIPSGTAAIPGNRSVDQNELSENGLYFSEGLVWAISTTGATYTAATASDHYVDVLFM